MLNSAANFLYATVVDMALNGGMGEVVEKNHATLARRKVNRTPREWRDCLVCAHEVNNDRFCVSRSPNGVVGPEQTIWVRLADGGRTVFHRILLGVSDRHLSVDRCSGLFSDHVHIAIDDYDLSGGVAFSTSGRFLYASSVFDLYQVDMEAADIASSLLHVASWDSTYSPSPPFATLFDAAQLASDGKIYISTGNGTDKLHVINYPDSLGADIQQHAITLRPGRTPPNPPHFTCALMAARQLG
ncbi:MAG: hypothetical protein IPO17_02645 [Flavobacteriales bacterium]|nr:hypothetical protein [Flavobacteriales bacterium]